MYRLSQSIGSCVRFNGPHNTGESRQFVHTTLEKLSHFTKGMCEPSHFTKGMCEPSHFTKGMCGPSHFTKGKCRPQINLMILIVWATVENPWGSVERTVPSGEFLGCLHCAAGQCESSLVIFLPFTHPLKNLIDTPKDGKKCILRFLICKQDKHFLKV